MSRTLLPPCEYKDGKRQGQGIHDNDYSLAAFCLSFSIHFLLAVGFRNEKYGEAYNDLLSHCNPSPSRIILSG